MSIGNRATVPCKRLISPQRQLWRNECQQFNLYYLVSLGICFFIRQSSWNVQENLPETRLLYMVGCQFLREYGGA
jgi:hypothetical protein